MEELYFLEIIFMLQITSQPQLIPGSAWTGLQAKLCGHKNGTQEIVLISADGMLYLFEEKSGHVALVKPGVSKLDIVSEFQITKGEGPFWAHPVINKGKLYIRHGDVLMVYQIKSNS